jgi:hypothetical protein
VPVGGCDPKAAGAVKCLGCDVNTAGAVA